MAYRQRIVGFAVAVSAAIWTVTTIAAPAEPPAGNSSTAVITAVRDDSRAADSPARPLFECGSIGATARAVFQPSASDDNSPDGHDGGVVTTSPNQSPQAIEMKRRLGDPQLRAQLRAEERTSIREQNADLGPALGIDAAKADELIELLTDQQLARLDSFRMQDPAVAKSDPQAFDARFARLAAAESKSMEQISALLGEEAFERYQNYQDTRYERLAVSRFDARLDVGQKLTAEQRDRLMSLLRQQRDQAMRTRVSIMDPPDTTALHPGAVPDQRALALLSASANEKGYWRTREESRALIQQVAQILTPAQSTVFAQMEADKLDRHRAFVERLRTCAGLSPQLPEQPPAEMARVRHPVDGQVTLRASLRVNGGAPVVINETTDNGKTVGFTGPDSLWVEATPTLFEDDWTWVELQFFEEKNGHRRAIQGPMGVGGKVNRTGDRTPSGVRGGATTQLLGSKAYSISVEARVSPAQ